MVEEKRVLRSNWPYNGEHLREVALMWKEATDGNSEYSLQEELDFIEMHVPKKKEYPSV